MRALGRRQTDLLRCVPAHQTSNGKLSARSVLAEDHAVDHALPAPTVLALVANLSTHQSTVAPVNPCDLLR